MLGERIKKLRIKKGVLQQDLAKALSVSQNKINSWENNLCEPNLTELKRIATYFKVSTDYLLMDIIRFDFNLREFHDDNMLTCPQCESDCLHFNRVLNVDFGNEKSSGIAIEFWCESNHYFYLLIESYKGNTYRALVDEHCILDYEKNVDYVSTPVSLTELFEDESYNQKKYKILDEHGKKMISIVLNEEYKRVLNAKDYQTLDNKE